MSKSVAVKIRAAIPDVESVESMINDQYVNIADDKLVLVK